MEYEISRQREWGALTVNYSTRLDLSSFFAALNWIAQSMSKASKRRKRQAAQTAERKLLRQMLGNVRPPKIPLRRTGGISYLLGGISRLWKLIVGVSALVTIVAGYYQFGPTLVVSSTGSVSDADPFRSAFIIKNEGPLAIKDIQISYYCNYVAAFGDEPSLGLMHRKATIEKFRFRSPNTISELPSMSDAEGTSVIFPGHFLTGMGMTALTYTYCDVTVTASFRKEYEFWRRNKEFRFVTRAGRAGELVWFPKSIAEPIEPPRDNITNAVRFVGSGWGAVVNYNERQP